jgi:undecaprenyl-diphosphatase
MVAASPVDVDPSPELVEPQRPRYERSPVLLFRLLVAGVVVLIGLVLTEAVEETLLDLDARMLELFGGLPDSVERFLIGLSQFLAVLLPVLVTIALVALRQLRTLVVAVVGAIVGAAALALIDGVIDAPRPPAHVTAVTGDAWIVGSAFPSSAYIAGAAAVATILGVVVGRRWGRIAWTAVGVVALFRLLAAASVPAHLLLALGVGWFVGTAVVLVFGAPDHRPTARMVADALAAVGLPVSRLAPASVDARGSTPWFATTTDSTGLFVKTLGRDERDADLLFRVYRYFRLKNVGDQRPFASLRRAVEHEALVALKAKDSGVRTPRVRNVATVGPDGMLLAYEAIEGRSIDSLDGDFDDALLRQIWEQVAILRRERIAHRDLRRANIFQGSDGEIWIIDFGFSELAASDRLLQTDVAELIAATGVVTGAERAVAAAVSGIGPGPVGQALPMLQPLALAGATHKAVAGEHGLMADLQGEVRRQTGVEEVTYEPLARVSARTALMLVSSLIALYVLIPQLTDVAGMFRQLRDADWAWVGVTVLLSVISYVGASISLMSFAPSRVPARDALEVSLSGSFVNRITPAGVGGMGLNVRYLQKRGADTVEAASRLGVNSLLGVVIHLSLTLLFLLWAGKEGSFDFRLPKVPALVALLVVLVAAGVIFLVPWGRQRLLGPAVRALRHAWKGVIDLAREPAHLGGMVLGGTIITVSYLCGLYAAVRAFGGGLAFSAVGAVYLAGSAIGQAAPTPGGLGAVEAALIAGLVGVGLDKEVAVPAVLLFRLATFWLPILPGWATFSRLTHRHLI